MYLTITQQDTIDTLALNVVHREREVHQYQINIDNYALALQHITSLSTDEQVELTAFAEQLRELLASEKIEQKKAKIMLAVLQAQVS